MKNILHGLLVTILITGLYIGSVLVGGCVADKLPKQTQISAPKEMPPVAPLAHDTYVYTGKVVTALDHILDYANITPPSEGFKVQIINDLTLARKIAVEAQAYAEKTEKAAEAKDAEAKQAHAAIIELLKENKALAVEVVTVTARAEKAEAFIDDHKDDIFGAKTHRFIKALTFWTILGLCVTAAAIIGIGVVGSMYGLPELSRPVFKSFGGLMDGLRFLLFKAAGFIWSWVPGVGHFADETLNTVAKHRAMQKQQPVSNPYKLEPLHIYPTMSATDTLRMNDGAANHTMKGGV